MPFALKVLPSHGVSLQSIPDGRSSGLTCGLAAFGHMEFEAKSTSEPVDGLRERFRSLANYVLDNGPVIRDGDTIGENAAERTFKQWQPVPRLFDALEELGEEQFIFATDCPVELAKLLHPEGLIHHEGP